MQVGDLVQIQDNNEWKGLYGIVDMVVNKVAFIFCVAFPCYLYKADTTNNIKIIG